ncbi:hypothetical protein [Bordetella genomosp. 11]|uniref:Helix-turn-helix domain-containing protein n=1 Tax=Bordetella genomosp. 11 TaxID=1416808 RepID=A0A261UDD2_9BORD|nr:hypothetical protein [Bordetella genomosp. 11]OZI59929.1 hypothetical protein CAL28_10605 [Bordetella genomosp. 11]
MTNKPMPSRDAQVIARTLAGESAASIAEDMHISKGRISQILVRNGLGGRLKHPGLSCIQWSVRQTVSGSWLCSGGGQSRLAGTPQAAFELWKADLLGQSTKTAQPQVATPPRTPSKPDALRLPAGMLHLAQRAAAAQPRLMNMGSRVREGGVL